MKQPKTFNAKLFVPLGVMMGGDIAFVVKKNENGNAELEITEGAENFQELVHHIYEALPQYTDEEIAECLLIMAIMQNKNISASDQQTPTYQKAIVFQQQLLEATKNNPWWGGAY